MADTTYEEAKRCPICQEPGVEVADLGLDPVLQGRRVTRGARIKVIECHNENRCRWGKTHERWTVQTNPDGSVPPPTLKRDKRFPAMNLRTEDVEKMVQQQLDLETNPGAELYRR